MVLVTLIPAAAAPAAQESPPADSAAIYRGVSTALKFDVSPPLRSIAPIAPHKTSPLKSPSAAPAWKDRSVPRTSMGPCRRPMVPRSFPGRASASTARPTSPVSPPDPVGDVGPNHYVAMSNLSFQIFDKTGASLLGPLPNNTLWAGFGGDCQTDNSGDPIVLYDQLADRWMLTQFTASGPTYFNCVAISTTPIPPAPTIATPSAPAPTSPTTPSTASGRTRYTSAPVSSPAPALPASAPMPSTAPT